MFLAKDKNAYAYTNISSLSWNEKWVILYFRLYLIAKVTLILSSISSGLEFWSVNHISIYENSEVNVFKK